MSAIQVDELWNEQEPWRQELEMYLAERDKAPDEPVHLSLVPPGDESASDRRRRRRIIQRRRLRGVRPTDEVAAKTTRWFVPPKKEAPKHPRYTRIKLVLAPDIDGTLVSDVKREYPKPAPNRRKDAVPEIDFDLLDASIDTVDTATTEVSDDAELLECEVVLEQPATTVLPLARIIVPHNDEPRAEMDDTPDPELLSMIFDGDVPEQWDCCVLPECVHSMHNVKELAGV
jgi:hypothetical protein